ncbi:lysosomal aspartic protease-like [Harmonia axyridis]|uniref:lysosomal aspartic protease-like n=1 Tax=Harmonia axyridis TaxID=115357 RepID=UPI001E274E85|nr:lysosomal aspartic protease-like [Harmonia axyridis]
MTCIIFKIFSISFFLTLVHCKPPVCNITSVGYEGLNFIEHKKTMRIQIVHQKSPFEQQINSPLHKHGVLMDWNKKPTPKPRTNDTIRLYRFLDHEFYGKIVIGHPGQSMNVALDTTWIYTWVISSRCHIVDTIGCWMHNQYNHDKSSGYKPDGRRFSVDADGYNLTGFYSYDNISITHSNVTNFSFIEMTQLPKSFLFNKADGVLGLGRDVGSGYKPFFNTLLLQKKIVEPIFSVYINRNYQSNAGGEITLGFADGHHIKAEYINGEYHCDKVVFLRVDPLPYWQFMVDKILLVENPTKKTTYCQQRFPDHSIGCKAIIDTSSSTIVGPSKEINDIHSRIGATKLIMGRYSVECDKVDQLPHLDFIIAGKTFTLKGHSYVSKVTFKSLSICLSALRPAESKEEEQRWVLGGAFLSEVYTIFNVEQNTIGLVRAA